LNANPSALAALKTLGSQGSTAQQAPGAFTSPAPITPPTLTPVPQINAGDSGAGTVSKYLQILGAIAAGGK
jgi:hypothetical protein